MSERLEPVHIVDPPIGEAEEVAYDPSQMGPGSFVIEVEFSSEEIDRLREAVTRGRYARFIKQAALELADREAERKAEDQLRESA